MSDFPEGTDWWKADDGRWYPPGAEPAATDPEASPAAEPSVGRQLAGNGCVWAIGLVVVLVIISAIASIGDDDNGGGSSDPAAEEADAYRVCKNFVERRLRSPGTAGFPNFFDDDGEVISVATASGYRISSHVDSENGFGALVRTPWQCEVSLQGDRWILRDLQLVE